jgi:hypothetical protein
MCVRQNRLATSTTCHQVDRCDGRTGRGDQQVVSSEGGADDDILECLGNSAMVIASDGDDSVRDVLEGISVTIAPSFGKVATLL